jgi:cytochrome c2
MPPKTKVIPEPVVNVPEGDVAKGKALFDEQCSACHSMEVSANFILG